MRFLWVMILSSLLLISCSTNEETQVITKKEVKNEETSPVNELIEQELNDEKEEVEMVLEFNLPDEQVTVNLQGVKILREYLTSVADKQKQIDQMQLIPVEIPDYDTVYLLQFSCNANNCSYLLLDQNESGRSYLLADLVKFQKLAISPDRIKILFVFRRLNEMDETVIQKDKLMVMDIPSWELQKLVPVAEEETLLNNYQLPFLNADWTEEETIQISLPDISEQPEALFDWYQLEEKPTKTLELIIEAK